MKSVKRSDLIIDRKEYVYVYAECPGCKQKVHLTTQTGDCIGLKPGVNACGYCHIIFSVEDV